MATNSPEFKVANKVQEAHQAFIEMGKYKGIERSQAVNKMAEK
jgi:hypothetical protein